VLRLTGDHLVFTLAGLKAAASVAVGDTVFADLSETERCSVVHVASEDAQHKQTYFGLNCLESIVLADGIKTSTFGHYHWFPAAWMKYASKVLGVKRASKRWRLDRPVVEQNEIALTDTFFSPRFLLFEFSREGMWFVVWCVTLCVCTVLCRCASTF
jgi:hypothetical protein